MSIKISACLMVKNEEKLLPQCLESIKNYVDEICILDTGSTDGTLEIAKAYGAVINHQPWENDFSKHRNESLKYPTGDWILVIDADEKLESTMTPEQFRTALDGLEPGVSSAAIILKDMHTINGNETCTMEYNRVMMFRRGQISYKGIVHNKPVVPVGTDCTLFADISIYHYGYDLDPEKMKKKHENTKLLLEKRLIADWKDWPAHFFLAMTSGAQGDIEKLIYHAQIYIENKENAEAFNPTIYYTTIMNLFDLDRVKEAKKYLDVAVVELPECIDIAYCQVTYAMKIFNFEKVLNAASKFCSLYSKLQDNPAMRGTRFIFHNRVASKSYCEYLLSINLIGKGMEYLNKFEKSLMDVPNDLEKKYLADMASKDLNDIGVNWTNNYL